jgi:hypothetical protein
VAFGGADIVTHRFTVHIGGEIQLRMWTDNRQPYNPGCTFALGMIPISVLGFLIFPDAGFFAPLLLVAVIFGSVFLLQRFWRWYYQWEPGMHRLENKEWVYIKDDRISFETDMPILYDEITYYSLGYNSVRFEYSEFDHLKRKAIQRTRSLNFSSSGLAFYNEFDEAYKVHKSKSANTGHDNENSP